MNICIKYKWKIKVNQNKLIKHLVCYFDDIINGTKINFNDIFINNNLYENISVYNISHKTPTASKPLRIRFDKIDGFIMSLNSKIKHLVFDYGLLDKICYKSKYRRSNKSGITNSISYNFGRIKTDSCNSLPIKNILTFHNVIILIKSVVNKNETKYYYNTFLEKGSHQCKF